MKVFATVMKIVAALAAIAGIVYVVATYGDKIVAWAKKLLNKTGCCCKDECECECAEDEQIIEDEEAQLAEESATEECAVQAEEADFEG